MLDSLNKYIVIYIMNQKIHLVVYGDKHYGGKTNHFLSLKNKVDWFDEISFCGPDDLSEEFKNNKLIQNVFNSQGRGGGWWTWKPQIIYQKLNEIKENDILIYLDAGCSVNTSGGNRFKEYIDMLNNSDYGILNFHLMHPQIKWTNGATFDYHNIDFNSDNALSNQILSGIIVIKKNSHSLNIIEKWRKVVFDDPYLFSNHYNKKKSNANGFIDHRHDQSNFSLLCKKYGSITIPDETYFGPHKTYHGPSGGFGGQTAQKFPFWATRTR